MYCMILTETLGVGLCVHIISNIFANTQNCENVILLIVDIYKENITTIYKLYDGQ